LGEKERNNRKTGGGQDPRGREGKKRRWKARGAGGNTQERKKSRHGSICAGEKKPGRRKKQESGFPGRKGKMGGMK